MGPADLLKATILALPIAIIAVDRDGVVLGTNASSERAFALPAGRSAGRLFTDVGGGAVVPGLTAALERALRGEPTEPFETIDAVGRSVTCRVATIGTDRSGPLLVIAEDRGDAGALAEQVRILEDELRARRTEMDATTVELKMANEELQLANDELHTRLAELRDAMEAGRHKDDFLAMLAHELRNPLAPILSAMQVIRRHPDNNEFVQRAREIVERQVRHQAQLLDDLLDVSRITRGRITLRKAPIDVRSALAAAVEASRPVIDARSHTLAVVLPDEPVPIEADATRLTQVVTNLLDNAAKYTNAGGQVELSAQREAGHVVVRVRDTGIGIPPDMQSRIFELFTQGDVPIARSLGGLGLGLTLVRSLTELHGGTVEVKSEGSGRGSEFIVRLPAGNVNAPGATEAASMPARRRVLVIEDNADAREMLRMALQLEGHEVETAADGVSGVESALRAPPDLVLVDIGLPGLDGYAVARRLRTALGDRVTLVALTGYGQSEDRRRTSEAGFDAHLVKPVDPDVLTRALATGFRSAA
jgi:signal transduction histidine kinase/ActR/RegA family two-component response regulator